jgi:hypothetical protein
MMVFNLTLDDDNAYYANGVLVRNCADALAITFGQPVSPRTVRDLSQMSRYKRRPSGSGWAA